MPADLHPRASGRRRVPRAERGASSAEAALALPFVVVLVFSIVQGAVTMHAGTIAQAVAQATFEVARSFDASVDDAIAAGTSVAEAAGSSLGDVAIQVVRTETLVEVKVTGTAPSLIPGMPVGVDRGTSGPRERWVD